MTFPLMLFKDNATGTLASPITAAATSLTLVAGEGSNFPVIAGNKFFIGTLVAAGNSLITEVVWVTATAADTFTILRGQEGTVALAWNAGDIFQMGPTAGTMALMMQIVQAQSGSATSAQDTGTVNAYAVVLSPAVTTRQQGMVIDILAATSNTGPSTLNLGAGSFAIVNPNGSALGTGAIVAAGAFTIYDPGSGPYQLISASQESQSSAGIATTGDFKWRPTSETISGWVTANTLTIGNAASNATGFADPTTINLFEWHWNEFSNVQCPLRNSAGALVARGVNAAADFAANCAITTLDMRGKSPIGVDTMGGPATTLLSGVPFSSGSATIPGSILGQNLHTLTPTEIPQIDSSGGALSVSVSITGVSNYTDIITGSVYNVNLEGGPSPILQIGSPSPVQIAVSGSGSGATSGQSVLSYNTGGGAHNTVHLAMSGTWYLKL
jgi:hypothetical protein